MNRQEADLRVGDAEREDAARKLGEHFAVGRLTRDEYDERLERVFAARTWADLNPIFRDLPQEWPHHPSRPVTRHPMSPMNHRSGRHRIPFLPVLLILIGLAIFFHSPWIVWLGLGVLLLTGRFGWARGGCHPRWAQPR